MSGLIIADQAVVGGHGTVSRLNIRLTSACPETAVFQEDSFPEIFGVVRKLWYSVVAESSSTALCGGSVNYCNS